MTNFPSTKDFLGFDIDTFRRLIEYQSSPETVWSIIQSDHVRPISSFDISNTKELKEAFGWRNAQPLLKQEH